MRYTGLVMFSRLALQRLARRLSCLLVLLLAACPERNHIANEDRVIDAAPTDTPRVAPKIILLIGDGMGRGQLESASIYQYGEPGKLFMQSLPVHGEMTTSSPSGITDSAASATTIATGEFTLNGRVGVDLDNRPVKNLVELAKEYGMATGVVSTTQLAHATPAAFTAHVPSRSQYHEIAAQMAALEPDVMLGGGRSDFENRGDGRNLSAELVTNDYHLVYDATQLAAASASQSPRLLGLFAPGHIPYRVDRTEEDDYPTLSQMSLAALDRLDQDPQGFFLMIEGGRIDHAGHANQIERSIGETLGFDETVQSVAEWAAGREDVTILVTADHETGGLEVTENRGEGVIPGVRWRWGSHTNTSVDSFGSGPGSEYFHGFVRDHRWVHGVVASRIGDSPVAPPPQITPDGNLEDLVGATVASDRQNTEDNATRLTRLTAAANERGLAIGLEGLFRWDTGATVLLIDLDYGLATGPRTLNALDDPSGAANELLSTLSLPIPADNGFGADVAFVTVRAQEIKLEQLLDNVGLRGLRLPYGSETDLKSMRIVSNYADDVRSLGLNELVQADRGLELFVRWQELYPGQDHRPEDAEIAIWAVQVEDDGTLTNQSLPGFPGGDPKKAPNPLILEP